MRRITKRSLGPMLALFFFSPSLSQAQQASSNASTVLRAYDQALDEVAERAMLSVVEIKVNGYGPREHSDDDQVVERQRAIGSGVIVDSNGYIVTNHHVVSGAQRIRVVLAPATVELAMGHTNLAHRQRTYEAKLIGVSRQADLALIKIDATGLPFIPLPLDFRARLGQTVLAIGSPEGLDHTVTKGIISAVSRQPELDRPMVYIQTDAPINPGNSGGPLIDRDGNLVGINTFIVTEGGGSEGLGFAIPEPTVRFVYQELKAHGRVRQAEIGVNAQTITPTLATGLNLPQDWGVIISDVFPGSPAEKAGLKPTDIILAIDSRPVDSLPKYTAFMYMHPRDSALQIDVLRRNGSKTEKAQIVVTPTEVPTGLDSLADLIDPQTGLVAEMGTFVVDLDQRILGMFPDLRSRSGVLVAAVLDYEAPISVDLNAGDVLRAFNGRPLSSIAELRSQIVKLKVGDPAILEIERHGVIQYVAFEMD